LAAGAQAGIMPGPERIAGKERSRSFMVKMDENDQGSGNLNSIGSNFAGEIPGVI
jgi:hypothetical protein